MEGRDRFNNYRDQWFRQEKTIQVAIHEAIISEDGKIVFLCIRGVTRIKNQNIPQYYMFQTRELQGVGEVYQERIKINELIGKVGEDREGEREKDREEGKEKEEGKE